MLIFGSASADGYSLIAEAWVLELLHHTHRHTVDLDPAVHRSRTGPTHRRNTEMTTTTTANVGTQQGRRTVSGVRRLALAVGSLLAAIGSRWNAFAKAGQLGPDHERSIGRHTGARI
jgi:hypothetical protein